MPQSSPSDFDEDAALALPEVAVSRDYKFAHPRLIARFARVKDKYESSFPGQTLIVTCVYRSPEEQRRLYRLGRYGSTAAIVTNCDGKHKTSRHNSNPSTALDVAVILGGKITWDEKFYYPLGPICKENELSWGGFFKSFPDMPHIELPKEDCGD